MENLRMSLTTLGPDTIAQKLYTPKTLHTPLPHPSQITEKHIKNYWNDGFLAVENVFSPTEIESAKAGLAHLIAGNNPDFKGISFEESVDVKNLNPEQREAYVRKLMYFTEFEPRLQALSEHPTLRAILKQLLGTESLMIQDMALLKPPHVGREKPWHQDNAYFLYQPFHLILGTWTALDEATPENGCMHVIPESHKSGPRPHYHDRDCQLPDELVATERDTVVPLKPGGVLFFNGLLHHGTPPNRSAARRRALQFHYASVDCTKLDGPGHEQFFADKRGYAGCAGGRFGKPMRPIHEADF
jgi:phytanoyl-CoA hydroxylase